MRCCTTHNKWNWFMQNDAMAYEISHSVPDQHQSFVTPHAKSHTIAQITICYKFVLWLTFCLLVWCTETEQEARQHPACSEWFRLWVHTGRLFHASWRMSVEWTNFPACPPTRCSYCRNAFGYLVGSTTRKSRQRDNHWKSPWNGRIKSDRKIRKSNYKNSYIILV